MALETPWGLTRDITLSIEYYLKTQKISRDNKEQTLFDFFRDPNRANSELLWLPDFPDDLGEVKVPALAISAVPEMLAVAGSMVAGGRYVQEPRRYTIYGFCGGETNSTQFKDNRAQMIQLMDDLYYLFNGDHMNSTVISLYHFDSNGNIDSDYDASSIRITDCSITPLGTATGLTEAERFRFDCEFTATALTSRRE